MSRRTDRVNVTIQRELGTLIEEDVSDPRLAPVTSVTRVECSPDLAVARVYISALGTDEDRANSLAALESASGYLRKALETRIRMRHIPRIEFRLDEALIEAMQMLEYMDRVAKEDRLRTGDERSGPPGDQQPDAIPPDSSGLEDE